LNDSLLLACALAGACSALSTAWLQRHPGLLDVLDRPGEHKLHRDPVPAVGGVGIVLGLWIAFGVGAMQGMLALALALAVLLLLGLLDDHRGLSPRTRFVVQAAVALWMAWFGGALLVDFGALLDPGRTLPLGVFAWPITVFCVVGVLNAMNMIDGMDGLCGGLALISLLAIAALGSIAGHAGTWVPLAAAAAMVAFLWFNLRIGARSARVFLGNGGSLAIGGMLAWLLVDFSQGPARAFAPATALWLLAVPLIDTVSVMWRRIAAGGSPFAADHQHVHHLLLRAGWSVNGALRLLLSAQALCCVVALGMERYGLAENLRLALFLVLALAVHALKVRAARRLPPLSAGALH
jgi:UDP-GlcNAc:undecaprenyl-phosphate GlcNAc-1-phosphate transferase